MSILRIYYSQKCKSSETWHISQWFIFFNKVQPCKMNLQVVEIFTNLVLI